MSWTFDLSISLKAMHTIFESIIFNTEFLFHMSNNK